MRNYCSVYLRNGYEGPSCYYRVLQYTKSINYRFKINNSMPRELFRINMDIDSRKLKIGIQGISFFIMTFRVLYYLLRDILLKPKYVIIQRTILPKYVPHIILILTKIVVRNSFLIWDFDDDITLNNEITKPLWEILIKESNSIIVTHSYLKDKLPANCHNKVILLPTTDGELSGYDFIEISKKRQSDYMKEIRIVWVGTSSNLGFLNEILFYLDCAASILKNKTNKQLVLFIVCNKVIKKTFVHLKIINLKWSRKVVGDVLINSHIGIMPLSNIKYAQGKGGFKLVQYISTGLPVIASHVGFNIRIVNHNHNGYLIPVDHLEYWTSSIISLSDSLERWKSFSENSYNKWLLDFNFDNNLKIWSRLIN